MHDLSDSYKPKMPSRSQLVAQNWLSANCDSPDPAPLQGCHSWMVSSLSADDDTLPAPPAEQQAAATAASKAPAHTQPAPQQVRRQPEPGEQFSPFEMMMGGRLSAPFAARIVHHALATGRRGVIF